MPETQSPASAQAHVTPERIMQVAFGYAPPLMIEAAVRNKVFDTLDSGPKTVSEVSRETGCSERGLRILMNALAGMDFLVKDGNQYRLAPESAAFLVSTKPGFRGGIFQHTSRQLLPNWMQLTDIVRTGKPAHSVNQHDDGAAFFTEFVEALFPGNLPAAQALADALTVSEMPGPVKILDIASGSGVWGIGIAQKAPGAEITAVDFPEVLATTRKICARHGMDDSLRCIAGDLLDVDYGTGYHIATLGHILHSEGEPRSRALIKKVYHALAPGGTIAIADMLPNEERTGPPFPLIFAVNMLVNTDNGDTFSFEEIGAWLAEAGFKDARLLDAPSFSPLVLATKPG